MPPMLEAWQRGLPVTAVLPWGRVSGPAGGPPPSSFIPFRWRSEAVRGQEGGPDQAGENRGGEMADLIRCLSDAQANDNR
jgi:hypothetical protein